MYKRSCSGDALGVQLQLDREATSSSSLNSLKKGINFSTHQDQSHVHNEGEEVCFIFVFISTK